VGSHAITDERSDTITVPSAGTATDTDSNIRPDIFSHEHAD